MQGALGTKRYTMSGDRLCCNRLSWMQVEGWNFYDFRRLVSGFINMFSDKLQPDVPRNNSWDMMQTWWSMVKRFEFLGSQIHSQTPLISRSSAGSMKSMRLARVEALYLDLLPNPSENWKKSGLTVGIEKLRLGSNQGKRCWVFPNFTPGCGSHSGYQPQMLPWRGDVGPKAKFLNNEGPSEVFGVSMSCFEMLSFPAFATSSLLPHLILNWQRFAWKLVRTLPPFLVLT